MITTIEQVTAAATPVDARGNPTSTTFPTPPSWQSSDTTVVTVAPASDGLSAVCTAVGKVGSATISVSGTPAGATSPISGSASLQVNAAAPTSFVVAFGIPTTQTPPPPPPPPAP